MINSDDRHISPRTLDDYVAAGVVASIPIDGEPEILLTVDGPNETLRLEVSWDGEQPPAISDYVHITTDIRFAKGRNWATIAVYGSRFFAEAYPLLRSVADLVQVQKMTFATAVGRALASYHDLLAEIGHMPFREEIGLYGELLVVSHLIETVGPVVALSAWRGGDEVEEHDLGLMDDDVEIKTTTADSRRHWIGSLSQLRPTQGRRLWLLSIQLTGAGASKAQRLPDLVERISERLPVSLRSNFQARIAQTSFRPVQPHDSFRLLRLRSAPACFRVDSSFPRVDYDTLANGGADVARIGEVSYTIQLDGMAPTTNPPEALLGFGHEEI